MISRPTLSGCREVRPQSSWTGLARGVSATTSPRRKPRSHGNEKVRLSFFFSSIHHHLTHTPNLTHSRTHTHTLLVHLLRQLCLAFLLLYHTYTLTMYNTNSRQRYQHSQNQPRRTDN